MLVLDSKAFGGQAGASARIENYFGFPTGISGLALTARAFNQALKFGVEVAIPLEVQRLDCGEAARRNGAPHRLELVSERAEGPPVDVTAEVTFASGGKAPGEGRFYARWNRGMELFPDVRSTRTIFAIRIPRSRKYSHYDTSRRAPISEENRDVHQNCSLNSTLPTVHMMTRLTFLAAGLTVSSGKIILFAEVDAQCSRRRFDDCHRSPYGSCVRTQVRRRR